MKAVAWVIAYPGKKGETHLWAVSGTSVVVVTTAMPGKVWQWSHGSVADAERRCVDHMKNAEGNDARLAGEPVVFDLPARAADELRPAATGFWYDCPQLWPVLREHLP